MRHLAEALIVKFNQHTLCITDKENIIMLENENAISSITKAPSK